MKGEALNQSRNKRRALLLMVMVVCITLTGCASFGPILLNKAVIQYDETVLEAEKQLLLLNIIRMHDDQPPHFTIASNISATFELSHSGGLNSSVTGTSPASTYGYGSILTLGKTVSDKPTITISPMQGKDFAQRLLKPIDTTFVNTTLLQRGGGMIDEMLRLIGQSFLMIGPEGTQKLFQYPYPDEVVDYLKSKGCFKEKGEGDCFMVNRPPRIPLEDTIERVDTQHYELFRQVVLHIRAMFLSGRLQAFLLCFDVPYEGIEGTFRPTNKQESQDIMDTIDALEKQYCWKKIEGEKKGFVLTKRYPITALTDFDFAKMEDKDKKELLKTIREDLALDESIKLGEGMIIVLFRGDQRNRWPMYGYFSLRNFRQVLQFLAESLKDQPGYAKEYSVAPNRFTEELGVGKFDNPSLTLTISSGTTPPKGRLVDVDYKGESFWISSSTDTRRWDREVFSMLYEIFQFNRIEPPVAPPSISITK